MRKAAGVAKTDGLSFCRTFCFAFAMDAAKMRNLFLGPCECGFMRKCQSAGDDDDGDTFSAKV